MTLNPEARFEVSVDGDEIVCRSPGDGERRLQLSDLHAVYFATGDNPFDADWWILEAGGHATDLGFPLGATGEDAVLDRLKQLPGFAVRGMNSTKPERFLCWTRVAPARRRSSRPGRSRRR